MGKPPRKADKSDNEPNVTNTGPSDDTDISMKDMYKLMQSIKEDTESTRKRLDNIELKVSNLENREDKSESTVLEIQCDIDSLKDSVALLSGRLMRSETVNQRLQSELSDLKAHSMNRNVIFNFNKETDVGKEEANQDCVKVVRKFLSSVLKTPNSESMAISIAHRLGKATGDRPRPIIATFPVASDIDTIFSKVSNLKGTGHFISKQLPPDKTERKQFASTEFNVSRKLPDVKTKMVGGKLYINGAIQRKFLRPTIPRELTCLSDENTVEESDAIEDQGSIFRGFTANVVSLNDVRQTLDTLLRRQEVATASHLIFAYRISCDTSSDILENFESDGDHGVGLSLLKAMQRRDIVNKLFVATRTCKPGYAHIGQRRFDHVSEVCFSAMN